MNHDSGDVACAELLRTFSHDLMSPVTALRGYIDLLEESEPAGSADLVRRVSRVADHLLAMAADLARHAADTAPTDGDAVDVVTVAREAVELSLPGELADRARVTGAGSASVAAGRASLRRALVNLIDNAARYSDGAISIDVATSKGETTVSVADEGRGIDPADLDDIFDPYERGRLADPDDGGTGLGLASVRRLTRRLGGEIEMVSTLGVGTTVTLVLAAATDQHSEPRLAAVGWAPSGTRASSTTSAPACRMNTA